MTVTAKLANKKKNLQCHKVAIDVQKKTTPRTKTTLCTCIYVFLMRYSTNDFDYFEEVTFFIILWSICSSFLSCLRLSLFYVFFSSFK